MIWCTSDQHFWHKACIPLCGRPYKDIEEMNDSLIGNWNSVVDDTDTVYVLGDFALCGVVKATDVISRLKGIKVLIMGNHDYRNHKPEKWIKMGFYATSDYLVLNICDVKITLNHFPWKDTEHDERYFESQLVDDGSFLLHGHVHNHWKTRRRMINVGVDQWDFYPVPMPILLKEMQHIQWGENDRTITT